VIDGQIAVASDWRAQELVFDALSVLACDQMRLKSLVDFNRPAGAAAGGAGNDDEEEVLLDQPRRPCMEALAGQEIAEALNSKIRRTVREVLVDTVLPTLVSLKHVLQQHRSPLVELVMVYLRRLMADFRSEVVAGFVLSFRNLKLCLSFKTKTLVFKKWLQVDEMFSLDRRLAKEVEYDLQRLERQRQENRNRNHSMVSADDNENE